MEPRARPSADPATGLIACDWPVSWSLDIPKAWVSGLFLAVFTSDDGFRSYTPFVVRDTSRRSDVLLVVPFTTYQAYNLWPFDGSVGKNLYKGFTPDGKVGGNEERAFRVSFDRPYAHDGIPSWFDMDTSAARWAEKAGYDITYASSVDLHDGTIDVSRYTTVIFSGHDEYWSTNMRDWAEDAVAAGTHLAFLGSNNIYFHIRVEASDDGRDGRVVTCYKQDEDPEPGPGGPTERWRTLGKKHRKAEHGLLGVQYNGMVAKPVPLVVRESDHWFWAGTGLRDNDGIPELVAVEADGFDPSMPRPENATQTLLSSSPYSDSMGRGRRTQNTSLCENGEGTLVFVAGTFHWPLALNMPEHLNPQIQRATGNLMNRMLEQRSQ
ncbi:N,N-dimethylformamidase beta subunit family domain-containing protein [Streptomyces sp. 24-1644]|uniref:N,N-dimethylformamidase beta subunit family domain-containing protein n=1 Tax=Streptomyces sp. 24-1644 TaxID=3457315 RepID=UPI003FA6DD7E